MLLRKRIILVIASFLFPLTIHAEKLDECDKNAVIQHITTYAERLRTAYGNKDYQYLEGCFLNSGGGELLLGCMNGGKKTKAVYYKNPVSKHLRGIKKAISKGENLETHFEICKIIQHPIHKCFYGVTFHMSYSYSKIYNGGYMFLLIDFSDENQPQIHVRTWQPDQINGGRIPEDEIFSLNDFDI